MQQQACKNYGYTRGVLYPGSSNIFTELVRHYTRCDVLPLQPIELETSPYFHQGQSNEGPPLFQLQPIKSGTSPSPAATNQMRDLAPLLQLQPIK